MVERVDDMMKKKKMLKCLKQKANWKKRKTLHPNCIIAKDPILDYSCLTLLKKPQHPLFNLIPTPLIYIIIIIIIIPIMPLFLNHHHQLSLVALIICLIHIPNHCPCNFVHIYKNLPSQLN